MSNLIFPELFNVSRTLVQQCLETLHIPVIADDISLPYSTTVTIDEKEVIKIYVEISLDHISYIHKVDLQDYQFFIYYYPNENIARLSLFKKTAIEQSYNGLFYTTYDFSSNVR